jgi:PEGA domain
MKRAWVLAVALFTAAAPAIAQRRDPPLAQSLAGDAKREYELGRELYRGGDNAGALLKFRHAFDLSGDARLLWNVAVCHKNLRQYDKALPLVDRYLASDATLTAVERSEATEFRAALLGLVAPVTVTSNPPGAEVYLDGERVGVTPLEKPLVVVAGVAGTRQFRFRLEGYREKTVSPDVPGGSPLLVQAELERDVHEGHLAVVAKPREVIQIDGRVVGEAQWSGTLSSAPHVVVVSGNGKRTQRLEVLVRDNERRSLYVELEAEPTGARWPWIVGAGAVVAAGLAVGGYFLFRPSSTPGPAARGSIGTYQVP